MTTTRRHLLRSAFFAGTYCTLAPHARAAGANGDLRVAVVGVRGRGRAHLDAALKAPKVRLVAICDCDESELNKAVADLEKKGQSVRTFGDYRKLCEDPEIDAITIATPNHTHTLIAMTAAANGKHVYVEKPVSHNVWEGEKLAVAQEKSGLVIQHGFQTRSEGRWEEAFAWAKDNLGALTLARGFCYKPRQPIGKVAAPRDVPGSVDYALWSGPRGELPLSRKQFHYDWHWQSPYGNGDLGNQGPHQLDVCRWALGDPMALPASVVSVGGRLGPEDDGDTANTQIVLIEGGPAPILFEVRGLPKGGLDWGRGMDDYRGISIGNWIEYENGSISGSPGVNPVARDADGKVVKEFKGTTDHFRNFFEACLSGKQPESHKARNGHLSAALAHIGNHSLAVGKAGAFEEITSAYASNPAFTESLERMKEHLAANGLAATKPTLGAPLSTDGKAFTGEFAEAVGKLDRETYVSGFELPEV